VIRDFYIRQKSSRRKRETIQGNTSRGKTQRAWNQKSKGKKARKIFFAEKREQRGRKDLNGERKQRVGMRKKKVRSGGHQRGILQQGERDDSKTPVKGRFEISRKKKNGVK